jgi:undecaprenyl-diphosphatase
LNDYILAVILGIIEGLTEFLPVSSTAHLRISQAMLGINLADGYWKMFAIVIQLGAVLCLPFYFRKRIAAQIQTLPDYPGLRQSLRWLPIFGVVIAATLALILAVVKLVRHPLSLTMIAFVCTAAPAFLLTKLIGKNLESLYIMGSALIVGGVIMWVVDQVMCQPGDVRCKSLDEMSLGQAIWIGFCQTISAVFPGTSRSMATIAAGQLAGLSRPAALEFSFFLSMPTMAAATLYDLLKSLRHSETSPNPLGAVHMNAHGWAALGIGFVISFVVAYAVVAWFMNWVKERGFVPFAIYRIIAGAGVLIWAFRTHH